MSKISEAGKLYLEDYYILNEAKKEAGNYLDDVLKQVHNIVSDEIKSLDKPYLKWEIWVNQSTRGYMQIYLVPQSEKEISKKSKISILYKDVRYTTELSNTSSVRISVWTSSEAKYFIKEVKKLSMNLMNKDIYKTKILPLDLNDSVQSAETISEYILDVYNSINLIIEELIENKNIE